MYFAYILMLLMNSLCDLNALDPRICPPQRGLDHHIVLQGHRPDKSIRHNKHLCNQQHSGFGSKAALLLHG